MSCQRDRTVFQRTGLVLSGCGDAPEHLIWRNNIYSYETYVWDHHEWLTHWGLATHIYIYIYMCVCVCVCVSEVIISSGDGLEFEETKRMYGTFMTMVNSLRPGDAYIYIYVCVCVSVKSSLVPVMAWSLSAPSHYMNQCWLIVNWTPVNKLQWNLNHNTRN